MSNLHSPDTAARLRLSSLFEPNDPNLDILLRDLSPTDVCDLIDSDKDFPGMTHVLTQARSRERISGKRDWANLPLPDGVVALTPESSQWPESFAKFEGGRHEGAYAPLVLFAKGDLDLLGRTQIGIVGARAATGYGEHVAMELAAGCVNAGYVVTSGGAYGIDGMAHRAALASQGGTIAVIAGGLDRLYPSGHRALLERVAGLGLLLSEALPGQEPNPNRFLARNRIIAALSDAVVVVEAGMRSGSLNTARWANDLSVPLAAVPGPVTSVASKGTHYAIREMDATLVTDITDIRTLIGD